jgi:hypothetical protein
MSGSAKLIFSSKPSSKPTDDEIEEIKKFGFGMAELNEPVDLADVSRLIGATMDFRAGARSYIDGLEGQAIAPLEFSELSKGDRNALELSSSVIRSLFDELGNTFFEPLRETQPALAERGYQMLWAALTAASIIGVHTESETERIEARRVAAEEEAAEDEKQDRMEACRGTRKEKADALYEVVKAIKSREPNLSAERIAPKVRAELDRLGYKADKGTSISTIKAACKRVRTEQC